MSNSTPGAMPKKLKNVPQVAKTTSPQTIPTFFLDHNNARKLYDENPLVKQILENEHAMHKLIIQNTKKTSSKATIMKAVVEQAKPHRIIPMAITTKHNTVECYCTMAAPALIKFCLQDNLTLKVTTNDNTTQVSMTLILGCDVAEHLCLQKLLLNLLKSRISTTDPVTINLKDFESIPGMFRQIYIDITIPVMLNFVLNTLKHLNPKVLILSNNNLVSFKCRRLMPFLASLDLSYNQIKTTDHLKPLLQLRQLEELNLIGNPICDEFKCTTDYFQKIREFVPNIKIIDLVRISDEPRSLKIDDSIKSVAAEYLIDQFMEHFFTYYDNPKTRKFLQQMYHAKAIFSLSSSILDENKDACSQGSHRYKHHSHNLLQPNKKTDYSIGPKEIMKKNSYLPQIQHDPCTFNVDILHFVENKIIMFTIHGVFRETTASPVLYSFSRTFTLLAAGQNGEFKIINDLLFVSNSHRRILQHLKHPFHDESMFANRIELSKTLKNPNNQWNQDCFTAILIEITGLHVEYARNLLQKSKWNMKDTLSNFIHGVRFDLIPEDHFIQEELRFVVNSQLQVKPGVDKRKLTNVLENLKILKDQGLLVKPMNFTKEGWRQKKSELKLLLNKTYSRVQLNNHTETSQANSTIQPEKNQLLSLFT